MLFLLAMRWSETIMNKSEKALPTAVKAWLDEVKETVFFVDRVTFGVSSKALPNIEYLKKHCLGDVVIQPASNRFEEAYPFQITLFQPRKRAIQLLSENLAGSMKILSAEIALDFIAHSEGESDRIKAGLLECLAPSYFKSGVQLKNGSAYFARRGDSKGDKSTRNLVIYSDRPSKFWNGVENTCCHVEWRFTASALEKLGLRSAEDLHMFKMSKFWMNHLPLRKLPSKTELGLLVYENSKPEGRPVGERMARKITEQFRNKYSKNGMFILKNALLDHDYLKGKLTKISMDDVFNYIKR